jgi:hypothetical protein
MSVYPTGQQYKYTRNENKRILDWSLCVKFLDYGTKVARFYFWFLKKRHLTMYMLEVDIGV